MLAILQEMNIETLLGCVVANPLYRTKINVPNVSAII